MSTATDDRQEDQPALGSRENWWGDHHDDELDTGGHSEVAGTDAAAYIAHQLVLRFVAPVCSETGEELSEPSFHLPKQLELGGGRYIEYRQHRHRRRVAPSTGHVNWGESCATGLPEFGRDVYDRAVATFLAERPHSVTRRDDYLEYAHRLWHDPQYDSLGALAQLVQYVREHEQ